MMSKYLSRYRLVGECCHAQWQLQFRSTEDYNWTIINHDGARDFHNKKHKKRITLIDIWSFVVMTIAHDIGKPFSERMRLTFTRIHASLQKTPEICARRSVENHLRGALAAQHRCLARHHLLDRFYNESLSNVVRDIEYVTRHFALQYFSHVHAFR